eukprot:g931.t1
MGKAEGSGSGSGVLEERGFELLKVIGKGSFGKVLLVRRREDGRVYALKTLRKDMLCKRRQILHTMTERNILEKLSHPFLTGLEFAFQSQEKLYMGLNYCGGGDIFFRLVQEKRFTPDRARLYVAEVLLGLEYMHGLDIIYRDLKTENLLLDTEGHIHITDFGLAKEAVTGAGIEGGTKTFCGTPEYLAPEMLENHGHGKGVDWWALGVIFFEMLTGFPPFYHQNTQRMFKFILTSRVRFPPYLKSESAKSLVAALLAKKVEDRLGCSAADAAEIREHPFFSGLSFEQVLAKQIAPEFVPSSGAVYGATRNFSTEFTRMKPEDSITVPPDLPQQ